MEFAEQLKKLRKRAGLSQEDVAKAVHVTRQSISKWESSDSTPDLSTAVKLAELFDVSLDYLVLGIKSKENNEHSLGKFLEDNWFLIGVILIVVCALLA